jgi:hypothetical protein
LFQASPDEHGIDAENTSMDNETLSLPTPPIKKVKISQLSSIVGELKETVKSNIKQQQNMEGTEFMVFGQQIGLQLAAMPLLKALEAQLEIQNILFKFRRDIINEQ